MVETVQRELEEETGLARSLDDFFLIQEKRNEVTKMILAYYATRFNGQLADLRFADGEISEARWMTMDAYWKEKEGHPEEWCNRCVPEQQKIILTWLHSA